MMDFNDNEHETNPIEAFRVKCLTGGYSLPAEIIADDSFQRFDIEGHDQAGFYTIVSLPDGTYIGCCGDWHIDGGRADISFCSKNLAAMSEPQREKIEQEMAEQRAEASKVRESVHSEAAARAKAVWNRSQPCEFHPYLEQKQVPAYDLRFYHGALIIKICNSDGEIASLQYIDYSGNKRFLKGGAKQGNYFTISGDIDRIFLCEGYATGATIHQITGCTAIVAMDAGNLLPVARSIKAQFPQAEIIISADNDQFKTENAGRIKSEIAGKAINARVCCPEFKNVETEPTDFNDL
ncbi:MAG: toprim domain-containing protein, partial [Deltaproteobacteria bacterium]|nr:toprim domain-containing protein [Deltaproteobacteria bacterium]